MQWDFEFNAILAVGIIVIIGIFSGFAARKFKFPTISGYIIIGIIINLSGIIPRELIDGGLDIITDISLGVIGYLVGGGLYLKKLKKIGKNIAIITPFEALGAWLFVALSVLFLGPFIIKTGVSNAGSFYSYLPMAIVLGAISCATAPAASLAIVREYKAMGRFTTTLLAIIVLDDAFAVIAYAIGSNVACSIITGFQDISWYNMLMSPVIDILGSILLGTLIGFALSFVGRFIKKKQQLLAVIAGAIFLCVGASKALGLSSILANMIMGFIVVNRMNDNKEMFGVIHNIEVIIFAMFFTLAGAHFNISVIKTAGILALVITLARFAGKFVGVRVGGAISHAPPGVSKYLSFGLFPIAGVTIGLALLIKGYPAFSDVSNIMINAILASVIINEIIAPFLTRYAIFKVGEAGKKD
ncbi:MAG: cation:proton antiporter [Actinomycetota bacterium]|nr:cation:proton antiporter [Actinomycetota bacterium]